MNVLECRRKLLSVAMNVEVNQMMEQIPDAGRFSPVYVKMNYYGTAHAGYLYVQYSAEHGCAIRASINPKGTDLEISNYVFFGSKQACAGWLKEEAHIDTLMEIYNHLAEKADDRM